MKKKRTAEYVAKTLKSYGISVKTGLVETGVLGYLECDKSLPTIAFRSDMDALSMKEETGLDFKSENDGFMHGCGHDGHMATLLIFAKHMSEERSKLKANILFISNQQRKDQGS